MQPNVVVEITQQSRLQFFIVLALLGIVLVGGALAATAGRALGISQRVAGSLVTVTWLLGIGAMIWYTTRAQGSIEVFPDALVVRPRLRPPIRLTLPAERTEFSIWTSRSRSSRAYLVGPMLTLNSGSTTVSFATSQADLREDFPESSDWPTTMRPPNFMTSSEGFAALADALARRGPVKRPPPQLDRAWN